MTPRTDRVLVAGIGNVFFGDDGFGPAVATRLCGSPLPARVDAADYGIRGVHLAYDLLEGRHRSLVLVDALPLDAPAGTLAVLEVDDPGSFGTGVDAHSMNPAAVLACLSSLGGRLERILVVGCRPDCIEEGMGLSPAVEAAVERAAALVLEVAAREIEENDLPATGPVAGSRGT